MMWRKKVSLEGPIELIEGKMVLAIPLSAGGDVLARYAKGIGTVEGETLVVEIQPWLAEKLNVQVGSLLIVDNHEGKFRMTRSPQND